MDEMDNFMDVGFMFDSYHEKKIKCFDFCNLGKVIRIKTIGDDPGHKQSGHYLWPASLSCAKFLISNWSQFRSTRILELGSGCGLPAVVVSMLPQVEYVLCTDYDNGTLELIAENFCLNGAEHVGHVRHMNWGDMMLAEEITEEGRFKLIIGSDLIYSRDVISPLFLTVAACLTSDGIFILCSSFSIGQDLEDEINCVCQTAGLSRESIRLPEDDESCKIDCYRLK